MTNGYHKEEEKKEKPKKETSGKKKPARGTAGKLVPKDLEARTRKTE